MLRSRDGNTFAAVYEVVPGEPWRVSMESFTDTGAMVRTVMPGAGLEQASRWCSRWEVGQCGLDELLHHHAGHVNQFVATHGGVVARVSLADRAAIDERLERQKLKELVGADAFGILVPGLVFPAIAAAWGLRTLVPDLSTPSRIGASVVQGCLAYFVFVWFVISLLIATKAAEQNPA